MGPCALRCVLYFIRTSRQSYCGLCSNASCKIQSNNSLQPFAFNKIESNNTQVQHPYELYPEHQAQLSVTKLCYQTQITEIGAGLVMTRASISKNQSKYI